MKWDFCVGNPAYQEPKEDTSDKPVYNYFMDEAQKIADKVEMITPARFLFNAGKTPKAWNEKMLSDEHLKVLLYQQNSEQIFPNTSINGGITITYRDATRNFGAIEVFTSFPEMRSIQEKMRPFVKDESIADIMILQTRFNLEQLYKDYPEYSDIISSDGKERRIVTSSFEKIPLFSDKPGSENEVEIFGLIKNKRCSRFIDKKYLEKGHKNFDRWKVLVPGANGSGAIGKVVPTVLIGNPFVAGPKTGYTQTFIGIGSFDNKKEAENATKYVKSKFARTLLGILKITQHNSPEKWKYVPVQDFTNNSDINWSTSIANIDQQLYKKYGLSQEEIDFIESHVKEME